MAYTFVQLQDEVLAYGFDATSYRNRVKNWLNEAQHASIRRVPTRDNMASLTYTFTALTFQYIPPQDCIRVDSIIRFDDRTPLHPVSPEWVDTLTPTTGTPTLYYMDNFGIIVYPTPDRDTKVLFRYVRDATDMAADGDLPIIPAAHQDILISYAVARAFRAEDDQERAAAFMGDYERGLVELAADRRAENSDGAKQVQGMWVSRHGSSSGFRS